jgi:hypothetical protein
MMENAADRHRGSPRVGVAVGRLMTDFGGEIRTPTGQELKSDTSPACADNCISAVTIELRERRALAQAQWREDAVDDSDDFGEFEKELTNVDELARVVFREHLVVE